MVVLGGHFSFVASRPVTQAAGTGAHLATRVTLVLDAASGQVTDVAFSPQGRIAVRGGHDLLPYLRGRVRPQCAPADIVASATLQGATGNQVGLMRLVNRSGVACRLPPSPRVALSWRGRPLRTAPGRYPAPGGRPVRTLARGAAAVVYLAWSSWCRARPWGNGVFRPVVELRLPLGLVRAAVSPPTIPPRCDVPGMPSRLLVSGFRTAT